MRPEVLFPLFAPVTALPGIGKRTAALIAKLAGPRVVDLLWHLPTGIIDRGFSPPIAAAPSGVVATFTARVMEHLPPDRARRPYKVVVSDDSGSLALVYFHARPEYLMRILPVGETRVISGRVEHYGDEIQITHPDHVATPAEAAELPRIEPVYGLTAGLTPKPLAKAVAAALDRAPALGEWIDPAYLAHNHWPDWRAALGAAHAPENEAALEADATARRRLAYDELLANQLALALVRAHMRRRPGRAITGDGGSRRRVRDALPFRLTGAQDRAIGEIEADMAAPARMVRLLQGDVGSGKTIVALMAMLIAVEAGAQAALMAPTELLARQHLGTIAPLAEAAGLRAAVLTGRDKGKARDAMLRDLAGGAIDLLIGTHAVFQKGVQFKTLALAVIDEQHKFGVHQRLDLQAKGKAVDLLVMTATPIPRTLTLTAYGDMEVSRLDEKPAGRRAVHTAVLPLARIDAVTQAVTRAIGRGERVYWVCPLVAESESVDLAAAEDRFADLEQGMAARVGLVHGRMKGPARDRTMAAFAAGDIDLLVATTVVEVGVDVPEATVMVIEHAERFGLAQLHQLRGRIGRGRRESTCLLLYAPPLNQVARARLDILRETEDGFRIAEQDLKLRGAGELLGTRQSGLPEFRLADLVAHGDLLDAARDDVKMIHDRDPDLETPRGTALRTLLYLFERDAAISYLRSG
ncbi:MAG: ATP-dependent DNA helicase RecG [Alphaproteobacteria bacterium]|jgi:ATP-dependent DNA helicase RecG|nr:ATP-dependent DNA helicase RecG [Alphaproteobacteria bacterium]MDP6515084.1 ATP-dependent DNA helicase RecG [Alphaproteobacteria bacterium]